MAFGRASGLTVEQLKSWLKYDPETGLFVWIRSPSSRRQVGDVAGIIVTSGHRRIFILGHTHAGARLAWLYMTGALPFDLVDHRDRNPQNDSWENLRLASHAQNAGNANGYPGRDLPKGVSRRGNRWSARIRYKGINTLIGVFDTVEKAQTAYILAARRAFGEFAYAGD